MDFEGNTTLTAAAVESTLQNEVAEFGFENLVLVTGDGATVIDTYTEDTGTDRCFLLPTEHSYKNA